MGTAPTFRSTSLRLVVPAVSIAVIGAGLAAALVVLAAWGQDRVAREDSITHVEAEIEHLHSRLVDTAREVSAWDTALNRIAETFDPDWASDHLGTFLANSGDIEFAYVVEPTGKVRFAFSTDPATPAPPIGDLSGGFDLLVTESRQGGQQSPPEAVNGIVREPRRLLLATAIALIPGKPAAQDSAKPVVLVLTAPLDPRDMGALARHIWYPELTLVRNEPPAGLATLPLRLFDGTIGGQIVWRAPAPGTEMLTWLLPALAAVIIVLGALASVLVRNAVRTARSLEGRTADLVDFRARFQAILDHSPSAIFIKDLNGRFTFANNAFKRRLADRGESDVIGKTDFHFLDPDTAGKLKAIAQDIAANKRAHQAQIIVPTPDGPRTVVTAHFPILDVRGEVIAIGGIGTDVTEMEQARTAAQELRGELAHVLRVRTAGEMATSFAHELNQPLTAIKNYVTGMIRRLRSGGAKPEEMTRVLEIVGEQAQRAGDIVRGIRKMALRESAEIEDCDINGAILEAVSLIANEARSYDVRIHTELAENLPPIQVNTVQIQQALINLARNAMEAMADGQPDRTNRELVIASVATGDDMVRISVSDTGPGISAAIKKNMFDPFFSTRGTGLGMGLPICRSVVESHGGRIWLDRTGKEGATFHFTLPINVRPGSQMAPAELADA